MKMKNRLKKLLLVVIMIVLWVFLIVNIVLCLVHILLWFITGFNTYKYCVKNLDKAAEFLISKLDN